MGRFLLSATHSSDKQAPSGDERSPWSKTSQAENSRLAGNFFSQMWRDCRAVTRWVRERWPVLWPWLVALVCWALPIVALIVAGSLWLYQEGWLLAWFLGACVTGGIGWWALYRGSRRKARFPGPDVTPALDWPPVGLAAWREVEKLAEAVEKNPPPLNDFPGWLKTLGQVVETVAKHYYPRSSEPLLEISLPRMARVVELAARDLRQALSEHVPLADKLTMADLRRAQQLQTFLSQLYGVYRFVALGFDPIRGVSRILRDAVMQGIRETAADAVVRWASSYLVKRTGYYAIMLYGGYITLDEEEMAGIQTAKSAADLRAAEKSHRMPLEEPFRILVVGRRGAGKSSLICALAGQAVALVDVDNPTVTPYVVNAGHATGRQLIIEAPDLDIRPEVDPYALLRSEVAHADLVLLVLSADERELAPEASFVRKMAEDFGTQPGRLPPAFAVVVTKADLLDQAEFQARKKAWWQKLCWRQSPKTRREAQCKSKAEQVRQALGLDAHTQVLVDCFSFPPTEEVRSRLEAFMRKVIPRAEMVRLARVRNALKSFRIGRDLFRPLANLLKQLFQPKKPQLGDARQKASSGEAPQVGSAQRPQLPPP